MSSRRFSQKNKQTNLFLFFWLVELLRSKVKRCLFIFWENLWGAIARCFAYDFFWPLGRLRKFLWPSQKSWTLGWFSDGYSWDGKKSPNYYFIHYHSEQMDLENWGLLSFRFRPDQTKLDRTKPNYKYYIDKSQRTRTGLRLIYPKVPIFNLNWFG